MLLLELRLVFILLLILNTQYAEPLFVNSLSDTWFFYYQGIA